MNDTIKNIAKQKALVRHSSNMTVIDGLLTWVESIDLMIWAFLGPASAMGLCIVGSAWGIWSTGTSLLGACVRKREIWMKNLISILLCEAIAIYGVIATVILISHMSEHDNMGTIADYRAAYGFFASGLTTGFGCLSAGICVGIIGGAVAVADASNRSLFVKCFIVEVFAEAIALLAVIIGIVTAASVSFK